MVAGRRDVLVLCYHAVSETWEHPLSVRPATLEAQVTALLERGYVPATFTAAVTAPPGPRTFAVTFDDAFASVGTLAGPSLARLDVPGTVFVPTAHVGTGRPMAWPGIDVFLGGPHEGELVGMEWDALARLDAAGWEIGSHTRSHPRLTRLDDGALHEELSGSLRELEERLGGRRRSIAYPYGDADERVLAAAESCGYEQGALLPGSRDPWPPSRPLGRPRIMPVDGTPWRFAFETSPALRALRRTPALGVLRRLGAARGRLVRRLG